MISVIVPVYNVEHYLDECIGSILGQTFSDFELILVDDGSTDGSPDICERYASSHSNIKVLHQPNAGVSAARNAGLAVAKGEYFAFIDSDDWVAPDFLQTLAQRAQETDADIITSGLTWWHSNDNQLTEKISDTRLIDFTSETGFIKIISQKHMTSPCAKLYKGALIRTYHLTFDSKISYGEDRDFNIRFLANASTGSSICYAGYFYRRDLPQSLSVVKKNHSYSLDIDYWNKLYAIFCNLNYSSVNTRQLLSHRLFYIIADSAANISKTNTLKNSIIETRRLFNNVSSWNYLRENAEMISAPTLLKKLILYRMPSATALFLRGCFITNVKPK